MLSEQQQRTMAAACVTVGQRGGRGVLVPGNLVITAAHCLDYETEGAMVLGDSFVEELQTTPGLIKAAPLAVEPVEDIAALGALDAQAFSRDWDAFTAWCADSPCVHLSRRFSAV